MRFGRPRSPAAHQALLNAAFEIFAEGGPGALNVHAICERAGSSRATFYRRWATVWECFAESIDAKITSPKVLEDTGDVFEALNETVFNLYDTLRNPINRASFGMLLVEVGEPTEQARGFRDGIVALRSKFRDWIEKAATEGRVRLHVSPDALLNVVNGLALNAALLERPLTGEDVRATLRRLIEAA